MRGSALIWATAALIPLAALTTLAVDWGLMQVAKTELQRCADAAARAAVAELPNQANAHTQATSIAALNLVNGTAATLTASDIEFGKWDETTAAFDTASASPNAVRVTARRTAARGNAIPLIFARLIGQSTSDATASAIACQTGVAVQLIGLSGINVQNNFFGGTYDSTTTTSPTHSTVKGGATAGSNAAITAGTNETLDSVILGPSGTSNLTTTNPKQVLTQAMSFPLPASPGAAAGNITVNSGTYYVSGGTYYCNDLTIANGSALVFTGPATIYVSGNVKFLGSITMGPASGVAGDLKFFHTGTGSFGSATANDVDITADMYCPGCDFAVKNNAILRGRFVFKTILAKNNLDYYYDLAIPPSYINGSTGGSRNIVR